VIRFGVPTDIKMEPYLAILRLRSEFHGQAYDDYRKVVDHPEMTEHDKQVARAVYDAQIDPGVVAATHGIEMIDATNDGDWETSSKPYYLLLAKSRMYVSEKVH
jgi:hypothetical protein